MLFKSLTVTREGGSEVREGFQIVKEPFPHVLVGQENRGRTFFRLPLQDELRDFHKDKEVIERGSFMKTETGTILILGEQPDPHPRIGLLLKAACGFRGASFVDTDVPIIAGGQVWDSPNGTIGVSHVVLAIVKAGDKFQIRRTGRLYGAPEEIVVRVGNDLSLSVLSAEDCKMEGQTKADGEIL